jgi:hypothetical protein
MTGEYLIVGAGRTPHDGWRERLWTNRARDDLRDLLRARDQLADELAFLPDGLDPESSYHDDDLTLAQVARRVDRLAGRAEQAARDFSRFADGGAP